MIEEKIGIITMLPTNDYSQINYNARGNDINYSPTPTKIKSIDYQSQHLYITTSEHLNDGDWYIYNKLILQYNPSFNPSASHNSDCKKIIASSNPNLLSSVYKISDEMIEQYCYIPSQRALITYDISPIPCPDGIEDCEVLHTDRKIKNISILLAKTNWNKEEVRLLIHKSAIEKFDKLSPEEQEKWIEINIYEQ